MKLSPALVAGATALVFAGPVHAQNSEAGSANGGSGGAMTTTATAVEVTEAPVIDGRPDEAVWRQAGVMTGFTQRVPFDGQPASERTEVRVIFDDEARPTPSPTASGSATTR